MDKLLPDRKTIWNLMKYLIIGGTAFIIELGLFMLLKEHMHYILANIIIYTIMFWLVFLANKFINFKSSGSFKKQLFRYTILYFINLLITNFMLFALGEYFKMDPAIGKIIVTGTACTWNFLLYKFVIYKE